MARVGGSISLLGTLGQGCLTRRSAAVGILGVAAAPVEVAEELVVVIGAEGALLGPRLGTAAHRAGHPSALDHPDQAVRRHGEQHHHQQDLQHMTSVGLPW